ncbi:hypothetical protein T265_06129 [Opisthorchis viverrini]|uniref:Uncharacterized protein n=1 Tax=Opisthorchis viverrini TaxID=6198 RepID=A0A074ZHH7_OPIVI|nr:hypothetical protein T265_06129 [Opisthorchis viverrini]KER26698.1 hypothetical protein T265_06129 [Opisthorchis viverrini]
MELNFRRLRRFPDGQLSPEHQSKLSSTLQISRGLGDAEKLFRQTFPPQVSVMRNCQLHVVQQYGTFLDKDGTFQTHKPTESHHIAKRLRGGMRSTKSDFIAHRLTCGVYYPTLILEELSFKVVRVCGMYAISDDARVEHVIDSYHASDARLRDERNIRHRLSRSLFVELDWKRGNDAMSLEGPIRTKDGGTILVAS